MPDYTEQRKRLEKVLNEELGNLSNGDELKVFCVSLISSASAIMMSALEMPSQSIKDVMTETVDITKTKLSKGEE